MQNVLDFLISFFFPEKSAFEYGLVNHALSASMRTLVKVGLIELVLYSCYFTKVLW